MASDSQTGLVTRLENLKIFNISYLWSFGIDEFKSYTKFVILTFESKPQLLTNHQSQITNH